MDFGTAVDFIYKFKDWERGFKYKQELTHFINFLNRIGSPHKKIKNAILIAGTKGKGSTAHILSYILKEKYKTGLYTSPHLIDICERIKINDVPIPHNEFVSIVEELKPDVEKEITLYGGTITTFELLTTIAFIYFIKQKTEFNILEVGLGGRLDATNVVQPKISVLTPISFDHTEILGETITAIAEEKCGIIKENGIVICSPQEPEVYNLIKFICEKKKAKLWTIGIDLFCEDIDLSTKGSNFKVDGKEYFIPLLGRHQIINTLVAMQVAKLLNIPENNIKEGIKKVKLNARLQIISEKPLIIFDGAHNVASAWVLRRSIVELFPDKRIILIFGTLNDKDKEGIINVLAPISDYVIITPINSKRTADVKELKKLFIQKKVRNTIAKNAKDAMEKAKIVSTENDLILATGSLYLIGELLK